MTGRPKQFNQDVLLAKAVECFWREGYQGVSIRDVATAAGVTTGTLYNEYGGKDALYVAALAHYIKTVIQPRIDNILMADEVSFLPKGVEDSAVERIRYFISSSVIGLPKSVAHQACLLVNSQLEFADDAKSEIKRAIKQGLNGIEKGLRHQLKLGHQSGEIQLDEDAALLQIDIFMTGLLLTAKSRKQTGPLQLAIDQFINHTFQQ